MSAIYRSKVVTYAPEDMYLLVNNIAAYPEFLPRCVSAEILSQQEDRLTATLSLSIGGIRKSFTTNNTMQYGRRIDMQLADGLFKELSGYWVFDVTNDGYCHIRFYMCYEFENKIVQYTIGKAFYKVFDAMMDAFLKRAKEIYGEA
ncbi:Putative oligoketide cyclase/dehydratase or lipid transport protein YfjG [uncultured Candidatus Thioglobus sp.]|nr:Putative oligoketide cyclase/dehydratase or lipid transport protein YfjG [uncultured Candidatus Thioglobus sp.]